MSSSVTPSPRDSAASPRHRICVITPRLSITGVPLAQARFAGALARRGHEVEFVIGYADGLPAPVIPGVKVTVWDRPRVSMMLRPVMTYLRNARPDVVFSAEDHLNGLVLTAAILSGSKAKISGSSRVSPYDSYSNKPFTKGWMRKQALKAVMWRANALTCVSRDMVDQYRTIFPDGPHVCVYNIIDDAASREKAREPVDHPWFNQRAVPVIVAAGTLTRRKAFHDLVEAFAILTARGRDARLAIFGEGHQRERLEGLVRDHGLTDRVWLPGRTPNPRAYFSKAPVSALSSRAEGLPNVLVETMVCGCTPASTDCPTGPREVIGDDEFGYLAAVHDPQSLAAALEKALDRPVPPDKLAQATAPFEESQVIRRHFEVLGLAG
jgi:glycosyltransferase involved in cell wall biosynthesis